MKPSTEPAQGSRFNNPVHAGLHKLLAGSLHVAAAAVAVLVEDRQRCMEMLAASEKKRRELAIRQYGHGAAWRFFQTEAMRELEHALEANPSLVATITAAES